MQELAYRNGMERLVVTVQELSLARDMDSVMRIVRTSARELTGADGATFILREGNLCHYADEDAISPLWKGHRFAMETCISGWAMLNRQPAVIHDIYSDERIPQDAYRPTFVKSLAMVPIRRLDPIGAIGNYWAEAHIPSEDELSLLQALADVTAVTLENVRIYNELELRVQQRTLELEETNKELETFSYSVSHDLRAPLRAITGYMNILLEEHSEQLDTEGKRLGNKVIQSAREMGQLINELLLFSRLGREEISREKIPMKELVLNVCEKCTELEDDKREVEFTIGELPEAEADPVLMRQVWVNLISNALKYTKRRAKAIIEISYGEKENQAVYYVKDNGAGFDMKYYDKLFGIFQRLHTQNEFEGTGLGLAIVRRIIEKHRGKIWADAQEDKGAIFYFSLAK